jgi:hypothetical protein
LQADGSDFGEVREFVNGARIWKIYIKAEGGRQKAEGKYNCLSTKGIRRRAEGVIKYPLALSHQPPG